MQASTHELIMMAISGVVFISIGYVAGRIIQRFVDIKEFSDPAQTDRQEYPLDQPRAA